MHILKVSLIYVIKHSRLPNRHEDLVKKMVLCFFFSVQISKIVIYYNICKVLK